MSDTQQCTKCSEIKSTEDFSRDRTRTSGIRAYCKVCAANYDRKYRQSPNGADVRRAYKSTRLGRLHRKAYRHRRRARNHEVGGLTAKTLQIVIDRNRAAYGHLTCVYCKAYVEHVDWHLEHKTALACGGTNDHTNLDVSCAKCNTTKGITAYEDFAREDEDHHAIEEFWCDLQRLYERVDLLENALAVQTRVVDLDDFRP